MITTLNNGSVGDDGEYELLRMPLSRVNTVSEILAETDRITRSIEELDREVGASALWLSHYSEDPNLN